MPALRPPVDGRWQIVDRHMLMFRPRGYGFGLGAPVKLKLPAPIEQIGGPSKLTRTITWRTAAGSQLRLQQLLALLGYLPLRWMAAKADAAPTIRGQAAAAVDPPGGHERPNDLPEAARDLGLHASQ